MKISKDEYVRRVEKALPGLSEETAGDLFVLGAEQDYTNDNDIFEAIHAYLGSLEIPVGDDERAETIAAIRRLIAAYRNEKIKA